MSASLLLAPGSNVVSSAYLPQSQRIQVYKKVGAAVIVNRTVSNNSNVDAPGLFTVFFSTGDGSNGTTASSAYWSNGAAQDGTEVNTFILAVGGAGIPLANSTICCKLPAGLSSQITIAGGTGLSLGTTGVIEVFWTALNPGQTSVA